MTQWYLNIFKFRMLEGGGAAPHTTPVATSLHVHQYKKQNSLKKECKI